jgi:hypothetical protein
MLVQGLDGRLVQHPSRGIDYRRRQVMALGTLCKAVVKGPSKLAFGKQFARADCWNFIRIKYRDELKQFNHVDWE